MYFIFDTETTSLPIFNTTGPYKFPSYRQLDKYDPARVVSVSWIVMNEDGDIVKQAYHVIRPDDFTIDNDCVATSIHGITQEIALETGVSWETMYKEFIEDIAKCHTLVAHNIQFDVSIMLSELYRYKKEEALAQFISKKRICTMNMGRTALNQKRAPKLCDLYKHLCGEDMENAHNAAYDTLACYKCFVKMRANK